jgi:4-hydroxymandelate oxidase
MPDDTNDVALDRILRVSEFQPLARERMLAPNWDFLAGGSWDEITLAENEAAWQAFRFLPRVLTDIRSVEVSGSFLGKASSVPIGIAPMAVQTIGHPDGEAAMARAAGSAGIPYILTTTSSMSMEDVAVAAPETDRLFQLYLVRDLEYTRGLVERAAASGYRAIVLTVDLMVLGYRERIRRSGFAFPTMPHIDPAAVGERGRYAGVDDQRAIGLTWKDLETIRSWSSLPLVLKGIVHPDDARMAVDHGVDAICVSNHGARQLDRTIATAHALPAIVEAVDGRTEIWVDGGIRRGLDVAIALALGANGVLVGRPFFWALAAAGQTGVERAIAILREEFELALPLLGVASSRELTRELLR